MSTRTRGVDNLPILGWILLAMAGLLLVMKSSLLVFQLLTYQSDHAGRVLHALPFVIPVLLLAYGGVECCRRHRRGLVAGGLALVVGAILGFVV